MIHVLHEHLHHLILCVHEFLHSDGWIRTSTAPAPTIASVSFGCHLFFKTQKSNLNISRMIYTREK
jgi:hypothetical protein